MSVRLGIKGLLVRDSPEALCCDLEQDALSNRGMRRRAPTETGRMELLSNSYTMGCPPVRGDNPRALASGLSYVQVDKHGITSLYHLHQC